MSDLFELNGPALPPQGGGPADSLVVLLHGYGADGNDLIGLAPHLAQSLPKTLFISPDAPFPCEMGAGSIPVLRLSRSLVCGFGRLLYHLCIILIVGYALSVKKRPMAWLTTRLRSY